MAVEKKILQTKTALAKNLAKFSEERNHNLDDLSLKSQLDSATVQKIANGKANPTLKEISKLADALQVPINILVSADSEIKSK